MDRLQKDITSGEISDGESDYIQSKSEKQFIGKDDFKSDRIDKDVLINPYNESNFNGEAYKLTLGKNYFIHDSEVSSICPESYESNVKYWGKAKVATVLSKQECEKNGLRLNERYITIPPGKCILGHTHEFIGVSEGMTILFRSLHELITSLVTVEICVGGNYFDKCNVTIKNNSDALVYIRVGSFISEASFIRTSIPKSTNGFGKDKQALEQIERNWKAENLLIKKTKIPKRDK